MRVSFLWARYIKLEEGIRPWLLEKHLMRIWFPFVRYTKFGESNLLSCDGDMPNL